MRRCIECGSEKLQGIQHHERFDVGGIRFGAFLAATKCQKCGELYIDGPAGIKMEQLVARALAELGVAQGDAFRFMRKAVGLTGAELAKLMGVSPETISRWETGRHEIDRAASALLGQLVIERAEGRTDTHDRLLAFLDKTKKKRTIELGEVAA